MAPSELKIVPPVIAHRGASAYAPENTLAAFKKAKELGAQWVEFDVMLTADQEPVVFHDEKLDRITQQQGYIHECSYQFLKSLDAGSWFHPVFQHEKIPSLKETFQFIKNNPLCANIEIKPYPGREHETANIVLEMINNYWPAEVPSPLISSFSLEILKAVRQASSSHLIGCLIEARSDISFPLPIYLRHINEELNCSSFNLDHRLLTESLVSELKQDLQKPILAYTVNSPERALELYAWGVDAVFTDCPDQILVALCY
jgi:glycerophosphoryl diester phosphodiesterase